MRELIKTKDERYIEEIRKRADAFDIANGRQPEIAGRKTPGGGLVEGGRKRSARGDGNAKASGSAVQGEGRPVSNHRVPSEVLAPEGPHVDRVPRPRLVHITKPVHHAILARPSKSGARNAMDVGATAPATNTTRAVTKTPEVCILVLMPLPGGQNLTLPSTSTPHGSG